MCLHYCTRAVCSMGKNIQEAIRQLQQQRADLAAEEERLKAPPQEQREALMAKVGLGFWWARACPVQVFVTASSVLATCM
jgi:hypothetical protein